MIFILKYVFIINIILFLGFSQFYFNRNDIKLNWKWNFLKIVTLTFWGYTSYIVAVHQFTNDSHFYIFTLMNFLSLAIFFWSYSHTFNIKFDNIFTTRAPAKIVAKGPYKYIRHPYYTSYLICYISILFVDDSLLNYSLLLTIAILYYLAAKDEEEKILKSENKSLYESYISKTKKFLPFVY